MPATKAMASRAILAAAAVFGMQCAPPAVAEPVWGINGTFATSSNGEWAKINERYEKQPSVRSTWTISSSCSSRSTCSGTVDSDEGWSAPIYTTNGLWTLKRLVPDWQFCADGVPVEGFKVYKIYPVGFDGHYSNSSDEYTGEDKTTGPSGSCGRNAWPAVRMPFYMKKL